VVVTLGGRGCDEYQGFHSALFLSSAPVGLPQIFRRGLHQIAVVAVQHFAQRCIGSHSGADAIENSVNIRDSAGLLDVFDIRQRPCIRIPRGISAHVHRHLPGCAGPPSIVQVLLESRSARESRN